MIKFKNEVSLHGTLAKDPTIRQTATGKTVASLTLLTKYKEYSEFHRVSAWQELANKVESLRKGDFVRVVGRLQTRSWDDKQTGQKKYITEIIALQVATGEDEKPSTTEEIGGRAVAAAILAPSKVADARSDDDFPF